MPTLGWVRTALLFSAAQRSKPIWAFNFKQSSDEEMKTSEGASPVLSTHVVPRLAPVQTWGTRPEHTRTEQMLPKVGGADRDRTGDPLLAKQVLSQLSYSPLYEWWAWVDSNYRPHPYQGCALTN